MYEISSYSPDIPKRVLYYTIVDKDQLNEVNFSDPMIVTTSRETVRWNRNKMKCIVVFNSEPDGILSTCPIFHENAITQYLSNNSDW